MKQITDQNDILFLCTYPATVKSLKSFCLALFHAKIEDLALEKCSVALKFQYVPIFSNGYVQATRIRKQWKFIIYINLWHANKNKLYSDAERYFYTGATLCHELHHVRLLINGDENKFNGYFDYLAFMESASRLHENHFAKIYSIMFSVKDYQKYRKYRYMTSPSELICMRYGYSDALDLLKNILTENERNVIDGILKSLSLLCETMEVSYIYGSQPIHLFAYLLGNIVSISRKDPEFIAHYPQFRLFLRDAGEIRTIEEIYRIGKSEHANYFADVLVRIFPYTDVFLLEKKGLPDDMYHDLECWANKYIEMGIRYFQGNKTAKIILTDQLAADNAAVITKTIALLNKRMDLLGMKHEVGSVFPAYKV